MSTVSIIFQLFSIFTHENKYSSKLNSSPRNCIEEKQKLQRVPWKEINTDASFHTFSSKSIRHESRGKAEFARVIKNSGEESFTDSMNQRDNKSDDELLVGGAKKRRRRRRREKEGSGLGQGGSQFPSTPRRHEKWTESGGEFSRLIISLFCRVVASRRREKWRDRGMRFFVPPSLSRRQSNNSFRPLPHAKSRARSGIIVFLEIPSLWMDSTVSEFYFINPISVRSPSVFSLSLRRKRGLMNIFRDYFSTREGRDAKLGGGDLDFLWRWQRRWNRKRGCLGRELDNKLTCRASFSSIIGIAWKIKLQNSKFLWYKLSLHIIIKKKIQLFFIFP